MPKHHAYNEFPSVQAIKEYFGQPLPKPHDWRLVSPAQVGEINGLPSSKGLAIATNGILVAIMQGPTLFIGHTDSFVVDIVESDEFARQGGRPSAATKITARKTIDIMDFV